MKGIYRNLEAELARKRIKRSDVAKCIGSTITTASFRLSKFGLLTIEDAEKIRNEFFPDCTLDYLYQM